MKHNLLAGIPEEYLRFTQLPNERGHNAVWDFVKSPDGRFYFTLCGENEQSLSALLYEYYPKTGGIRLICDIDKVWIVDKEQMPPSKIHTSIDFLPDGRLIMATHNTSPAPSHKRWLFDQNYEDIWQGYPGSIIMLVNPDTGYVNVRGIPVPRESIYGGMLGNDPRYYYFLGYLRGHFYRLDMETNEVKDYGKISEHGSFRLVKDLKGRLYGSTYTGELWRFDPATEEIEDLKVRFNSLYGKRYRRQLVAGLNSPHGTMVFMSNVDGDLIEFDPETKKVIRQDFMHLKPHSEKEYYLTHGVGGLCADENFVLYYAVEANHNAQLMRLVRWDILNGKEPENLGIISPLGKQSQYICEMHFDDEGILHMIDVCGMHSPYALAVDVKKLSPAGEDSPPARIQEVMIPNMHMVDDRVYYSHMQAERVNAFALHKYVRWKDSTIKHMHKGADGDVYCITGRDSIYLLQTDFDCEGPKSIDEIYSGGGALSCLSLDGTTISVLTSDRKYIMIDVIKRSVIKQGDISKYGTFRRLICSLSPESVLISDEAGSLFIYGIEASNADRLPDVKLSTPDAFVLKIEEGSLLLSGENDSVIRYSITERKAVNLDIKAAAVKGRGYRAAITGAMTMDDGYILCGTEDGMLFIISPDCKNTVSYGRLFSTGSLRGFVKGRGNSVLGIYGDKRDLGQVFEFSRDKGLVSLGKPKAMKECKDLVDSESEWAYIHYISSIVYLPEKDELYVGSGEEYGCVIRYKNYRAI